MKRTWLLALALVLTACGPSATREPAATPIPSTQPAATVPPSALATPSPGVVPSVDTTHRARAAAPPPPVAVAAPAAPPPAMSRSFGLFPVGGSSVSGSVTVVDHAGIFTATVIAHGLTNGSVHTTHIHLGSCTNPYGGMHLTVLGLLAGDAAGAGGMSAPIAPVYLMTGRYVIVYATASPIRIIACANLGPI